MRTLLITGVRVRGRAISAWPSPSINSRDHGQKATYFEGKHTMEILWTLAETVVFVCWPLGLYSAERPGRKCTLLSRPRRVRFPSKSPRATICLELSATTPARMESWGRTKPELVSAFDWKSDWLGTQTDPAAQG